MNISTATTFRRTVAGLLLLVGPAMILVASIFDPSAGEEDATLAYFQALVDDPDKTQLAVALYVWGFVLTGIGIIGLVHVIRRRGVVLANIGGALGVVGMLLLAVVWVTLLFDLNNGEHLGAETADRLNEDLTEDYWAAFAVFIPAYAGTLFGFLLLGAAIIRSKVAHVAAGALIVVGILVVVLGDTSKAANVVGNVLLLGGWGLVGLKLLGMKDEEWEGRLPDVAEPRA